jgi:hypothetical protein
MAFKAFQEGDYWEVDVQKKYHLKESGRLVKEKSNRMALII